MSIHVLFLLAGTRKLASTRYRILQFIPKLVESGIVPELHFPTESKPSGLGRIVARFREESEILRKARDADIVFIQKRLFRKAFLRRLKKCDVRIVFDFDDAIMTSHGAHWSKPTAHRVRQRFEAICNTADLILAGNNFLAEQARLGQAIVTVLPTVVDTTRYDLPGREASHDGIRLGWIGQPVNYCYLQVLAPVLEKLSEVHPGLSLRVISRGEFLMPGVRVDVREWSEDAETLELSGIDIGLMPLPDNEFAKGKCALKAIQYMAAGLPSVCSDVGANREVVRDGIDGFLVQTESDWFACLDRLIRDASLRADMGRAARQRVAHHFSLFEAAKLMVVLLHELVDHRGVRQ